MSRQDEPRNEIQRRNEARRRAFQLIDRELGGLRVVPCPRCYGSGKLALDTVCPVCMGCGRTTRGGVLDGE